MSKSDEILQVMASQRAILTLLREVVPMAPGVERAIEDLDSLMDKLESVSSR